MVNIFQNLQTEKKSSYDRKHYHLPDLQCGRILLCENWFFCLASEWEKYSFHIIPENLFCFQQMVQ